MWQSNSRTVRAELHAPRHGPVFYERTVEAELRAGFGQVAIVREFFPQPIEHVGKSQGHHLQLALSPPPQNAVICFPDDWGPHRFEHIGELFLLPAGFSTHVRSDCRTQKSLACDFGQDYAERWFDTAVEWNKIRLASGLDIKHGEIRRRLYRIAAELQEPGFGSDVMIEAMSLQIGIELIRHLRATGGRQYSGGLAPWRLRRIDEALAADPAAANLGSLASLVGLSVRQLSRAFRASRGIPLSEQIAQSRFERACRMLAEGLSIKQIAIAVGFSAPTNFTVAFRRALGCTPRQYRERARKSPLR